MAHRAHAAAVDGSDLRDRTPGHSLIEKLLAESRAGHIRVVDQDVVIDDVSLGWYWGVFGERRTAQALAGLDESWIVLHSVPVGSRGRDIDHIAIGPSGVYVINTKDHRGRTVWAAGYGVMIGDQRKPGYIQSMLKDIELAGERLSSAIGMAVPVRGALCLIDPGRITIKAQPGSPDHPVDVVAVDQLSSTISARRRELSDEQLERIAAAAIRSSTWLGTTAATQAGGALALEFDALSAELGPLFERRHAPTATTAARPTRHPTRQGSIAPARTRGSRRPPSSTPKGGHRRQPRLRALLGSLALLAGIPIALFVFVKLITAFVSAALVHS